MEHSAKIDEQIHVKDSYVASVKRGPSSWTYIYVVLGFALAIEGTIISMVTPVSFPWNVLGYIALGVLTGWLILYNGWFQNKLITFKNSYEDKAR